MIVNVVSTNTAQARFHERCEFESRSGEVYSIQHYVIKFGIVTCGRSVVFSWYSGFLHQ